MHFFPAHVEGHCLPVHFVSCIALVYPNVDTHTHIHTPAHTAAVVTDV